MGYTDLLQTHWFEILLSVASILVGIIVSVFIYRLQKKDLSSGEIERAKRAREELLDIIESNVINKQNPTNDLIENLLYAVEREHEVNLRNVLSPIVLLQDVSLRLQKSRHLDVGQKRIYSEEIENLIKSLQLEKTDLPTGLLSLFNDLEESINQNQFDKAKDIFKNFKIAFYKYQSPTAGVERLSDQLSKWISGIMGLLASVITASGITLLANIFKSESHNNYIVVLLFGLILIIYIISNFYLERNEKREKSKVGGNTIIANRK